MKGLALESIVKWVILLVAAGVIINLLFFFSDEIKRFIRSQMEEGEEPQTEIVEAQAFTTSQVLTYIRACWDKTGERFEKDVICYILKGDMSNVDPALLVTAVEPPATVDVSKFDPTKGVAIIRFEDIGNKIVVES